MRKISILTYYQMRSRYRKTIAGFVWVVANPIINFSVQAMVFKSILKINIENYPAFLLAGLMPWYFISQSVTSLASSLVVSRELLLGFEIDPLMIIATQVLDNFFNYIVASFVIIAALVGFNLITLNLSQYLLFVLDSLVLLPFVFVLTALVSFFHVFYRDIQFVTSFVMNIAFFLTPIFYSVNYVDQRFQWILKFNIFCPIVGLFQNSMHTFNLHLWVNNLLSSLGVIILLGSFLFLALKFKMKDFYINV
jgi:ABC-type polysaccharide/polyol phosphate export permease